MNRICDVDTETMKSLQTFYGLEPTGTPDPELDRIYNDFLWVQEGWESASWVMSPNWTMVHNELVPS